MYTKEESIKKIVNFFENSYDVNFNNIDLKTSNIIKTTDFNNLKEIEEKKGFKEANLGIFFRKGVKNQWKKVLNKSQVGRIENKFRDFMDKFGY